MESLMPSGVLIYLKPDMQAIVVSKIFRSLRPGGFLVLGETENVDEESARRLTPLDPALRIFCRLGGHY